MEQMINVYFDDKGNIQSVTPEKDPTFSIFNVGEFPLSKVEMFLTGKAGLSSYIIDYARITDAATYKLIKKAQNLNYVRSIDNYPIKINIKSDVAKTVIIENRIREKVIVITIDKEFKNLYNNGTEEQQEIVANFLEQGMTTVYITQKNDPYFLLFTIKFLPRQLFNEEILYINYVDDYRNTSAYAKRIIGGYVYREKL